MWRATALLLSATALALWASGSASAACVQPYCAASSVTATGATNLTDTSATLTGTINPNGSGNTRYAIVLGNGTAVGSGTVPDGTATVAVSATVTGLTPSTTYSYAISISNEAGFRSSATVAFTTLNSAPSEDAPGGGGTGGGETGGGETGGGTTGDPVSEEQAQDSARDRLGEPVKKLSGFGDLSNTLNVYAPGRTTPTDDTPVISGRTVALSSAALDSGTVQNLVAIACLALSCTTTVDLTISSGGGALATTAGNTPPRTTRRIRLPRQTFRLQPREAGVVKLRLPRAQRRLLRQGARLTLTMTIRATDSRGVTRRSTKTFTLKQKARKRSRKPTRNRT